MSKNPVNTKFSICRSVFTYFEPTLICTPCFKFRLKPLSKDGMYFESTRYKIVVGHFIFPSRGTMLKNHKKVLGHMPPGLTYSDTPDKHYTSQKMVKVKIKSQRYFVIYKRASERFKLNRQHYLAGKLHPLAARILRKIYRNSLKPSI